MPSCAPCHSQPSHPLLYDVGLSARCYLMHVCVCPPVVNTQDAAGSFIAAGGSGANEAKVFDRRNGNQVIGTVAGLTKAVFSVDWYQHRYLAVAGGDAAVRVFEIRDDADRGYDDFDEAKGDEAL